MYNHEEVKSIESPSRQVHELQMRLQASEKEKAQLLKEMAKINDKQRTPMSH